MSKALYTETLSIFSTDTSYDLSRSWVAPMSASCSVGNAKGNEVHNVSYPGLKRDFMYGFGSEFLFQIGHGTGITGVDQVLLTSESATAYHGQTLTISYLAFDSNPYVV